MSIFVYVEYYCYLCETICKNMNKPKLKVKTTVSYEGEQAVPKPAVLATMYEHFWESGWRGTWNEDLYERIKNNLKYS